MRPHKDPRLPKNSKRRLERQELSYSQRDGHLLNSMGQLVPCSALVRFHVMSSTRSRGTNEASSGTMGLHCVWSRVRKEAYLTEGVGRDTIVPAPPTAAGQQSVLALGGPVV